MTVISVFFSVVNSSSFVMGSDEGSMYTACCPAVKLESVRCLRASQGPITSIHCHEAFGAVDFSHLFVTPSSDWTVELWMTGISSLCTHLKII